MYAILIKQLIQSCDFPKLFSKSFDVIVNKITIIHIMAWCRNSYPHNNTDSLKTFFLLPSYLLKIMIVIELVQSLIVYKVARCSVCTNCMSIFNSQQRRNTLYTCKIFLYKKVTSLSPLARKHRVHNENSFFVLFCNP